MISDYLTVTEDLYAEAAKNPQKGLCCTNTPIWQLPDLNIPDKMLAMNYGCGSTVHPRDLVNNPTVLYVGVGGGMELLQFAYFSRKNSAIIGVDPVEEMLHACEKNLEFAALNNSWFEKDFVQLHNGNALSLPISDESIHVAAQNCLFNIFEEAELKKALNEMYRVLKVGGRLILSDPVCQQEIPEKLRSDDHLRALCLSGAISIENYIDLITAVGFGTVEVRARRPYRVLSAANYDLESHIYIESVEICAIKDPIPADGPCVFTGKTAIYFGADEYFDDGVGHILMQNQPLCICDKTAKKLGSLDHPSIFISESTWFYDGGGCC